MVWRNTTEHAECHRHLPINDNIVAAVFVDHNKWNIRPMFYPALEKTELFQNYVLTAGVVLADVSNCYSFAVIAIPLQTINNYTVNVLHGN